MRVGRKGLEDIHVSALMKLPLAKPDGEGRCNCKSVPRRVTRLFRNSTSEWIKLTWVDPVLGESQELVATPGHNKLDKFGRFTRLDALVKGNTCEMAERPGDGFA